MYRPALIAKRYTYLNGQEDFFTLAIDETFVKMAEIDEICQRISASQVNRAIDRVANGEIRSVRLHFSDGSKVTVRRKPFMIFQAITEMLDVYRK